MPAAGEPQHHRCHGSAAVRREQEGWNQWISNLPRSCWACASSTGCRLEVMRRRECELGETTPEAVNARMVDAWSIMTASATQPLHHPVKSMGGLIGGEAGRLSAHLHTGRSLCGGVLGRAVMYAMAVLEVNASMGRIVAAPTAGSAGVVPGLLLALQQQYSLPDEKIVDALFNAGAVGYLAMRNATVAGAVGGCQAEVGVAAAMAASAAVEPMGGTPEQCLDAGSTVLMNMLGSGLRPGGGTGGVSLPEPQRCRCGQRPGGGRAGPERGAAADPL